MLGAESGEADPWVGQVLQGRYRLTGVIGRGGMGVVYEAEQLPIGRVVAVKRLRTERSESERVRARFLREAQVVSRLKSPYTVRLFDFGYADGGEPFLVMERLEGETLRAHLERGRFGVADVMRVVGEVGQSLAEAHAIGAVHRDIKPDNVVLEPLAGQEERGVAGCMARVLDFGIARIMSDESRLTETSQVPGTPQYLSPERIAGEEPGPAADVYALGVIAYEMLSGAPPFSGTPWEVMQSHATGRVRPLSELVGAEVPAGLVALVMRMLARSPELRPANGAALVSAIERIGGGGAVTAGPSGAARTMDDLRSAQGEGLAAEPVGARAEIETGTNEVFGKGFRRFGRLGRVAGLVGVGAAVGVGVGLMVGTERTAWVAYPIVQPVVVEGVEARSDSPEVGRRDDGVEAARAMENAEAGAPGAPLASGASGAPEADRVEVRGEAAGGIEAPGEPATATGRRRVKPAAPGGTVEPVEMMKVVKTGEAVEQAPPTDPNHVRIEKLLP